MRQHILPASSYVSTIRSHWPVRLPCHHTAKTPTTQRQHSGTDKGKSGWILLLAPPGNPTHDSLLAQGIDPARVLCLPAGRIKNWQTILETSLGNGCFSAVLGWPPEHVTIDWQRIEHLSRTSGTRAQLFPLSSPLAGHRALGCHNH